MNNLLGQLKEEYIRVKDVQKYHNEKMQFEEEFYRLMFELGLENKFKDTYRFIIQEPTEFGYKARLELQPGLSFSNLQRNVGVIQENLRCVWVMKPKQFKRSTTVQVITKPPDNNIKYKNPQIKPYEMYLGLDFSLNPIINNCNENCMFLLAGATGSGKTRFLYMILLSWIINCTEREVEIYLSDCVKDEFSNFKYVKHVKGYANTIEQLLPMLKYLELQMKRRVKIISLARENSIASNIQEYNEHSRNKMSYIYVIIDELSVVMPDNSDSKDEKEMKLAILDILKKISKTGRSVGIFLLISTQKTVKEEMPSIIKNMSKVRISFRANDSISSDVIMGDQSAVALADRIAVFSLNSGGEKDYLFSPSIEISDINKMLLPHINRKNQKINFEEEIKKYTQVEQPPLKVTKVQKKPKKYRHPVIKMNQEDDYDDY